MVHACTHTQIYTFKDFFQNYHTETLIILFYKRLLFKPLISHISFTFFFANECVQINTDVLKNVKLQYICVRASLELVKETLSGVYNTLPRPNSESFFSVPRMRKTEHMGSNLEKKSTVQEKFNTHDF